MTARDILMAAGGASQEKLYVDDVFSTYLYTGNGSNQTINNGIDLAGKGGLVWIKDRGASGQNHNLVDTVRGATKQLNTNNTTAEATNIYGVTGFTSSGWQMNAAYDSGYNGPGYNIASWTFRRAPKFFDVVTYTGDNVTGRQIPHNLGVAPGMIVIKCVNNSSDWFVYHVGAGTGKQLFLNNTNAAGTNVLWPDSQPTSSHFTVNGGDVNGGGSQFVAYLFAHDPSPDGIIQCGSFTTDVNGNATVTLGWEPQYLMVKASNAARDWQVVDNMRGLGANQSTSMSLRPNLPNAETASLLAAISATGFNISDAASTTYIYLAIRRPNKPPKSGYEVYWNAAYNAGASAAWHSYPPSSIFTYDSVLSIGRSGSASSQWQDRIRGLSLSTTSTITSSGKILSTDSAGNEQALSTSAVMFGAVNGTGALFTRTDIGRSFHFFRRAPGFMDVVCYTGDGTSNRSLSHNLGVMPELVIAKRRSGISEWYVNTVRTGNFGTRFDGTSGLNSSGAMIGSTFDYNIKNTATVFQVESAGFNSTSTTYVAYLFATLPGISKVGSYTGNGGSQTISCGFVTGARFVLIKRTDAAGDWYVWDTARGIVAANDPHLSLNSTAAEVTTDDSVDPDASGFIVNQNSATNINVSGGQYIFLAIA